MAPVKRAVFSFGFSMVIAGFWLSSEIDAHENQGGREKEVEGGRYGGCRGYTPLCSPFGSLSSSCLLVVLL
jgi:hypothetical protein